VPLVAGAAIFLKTIGNLSSVDLGFRSFETYRLLVLVVGMLVIAGLWLVFERTSLGAQLRAAVDNRSMTQAIGINVPRLFSIAFAWYWMGRASKR